MRITFGTLGVCLALAAPLTPAQEHPLYMLHREAVKPSQIKEYEAATRAFVALVERNRASTPNVNAPTNITRSTELRLSHTRRIVRTRPRTSVDPTNGVGPFPHRTLTVTPACPHRFSEWSDLSGARASTR